MNSPLALCGNCSYFEYVDENEEGWAWGGCNIEDCVVNVGDQGCWLFDVNADSETIWF